MRASATGAVVAATAGVLCGGVAPTAAAATPLGVQDDERRPPDPVAGRHIGLLVIDNSSADSWLEVDRTLNTLIASRGTAGSDHDGGGGAIDVRTGDVSGSDPGTCPCRPSSSGEWIGQIGHPPQQAESGE